MFADGTIDHVFSAAGAADIVYASGIDPGEAAKAIIAKNALIEHRPRAEETRR